MQRALLSTLLAWGLALASVPAWAAANVSLAPTFFAADPSCDQPLYRFDGTADFTTDDDGGGNDFVALVFHDASGNYIDVDFTSVQTPSDPISEFADYASGLQTPPFAGFFSSRPLTVRVHDIPQPIGTFENSKAGIELASAGPVLFELDVDPAADAAACRVKRFADWALRIESLRNSGAQTVTTQALLDLDGAGSVRLPIAVPDDSMLIALFRAECSNNAATDTSWANVDIRVDGIAIPPTNGDDAFCTANGVAGHDEWVMARTSGAVAVTGPDLHFVQVVGASVGGSSALSDTELVVMVPEPAGWQQRAAALAALALLGGWRARRRSAHGPAPLGLLVALCAVGAATSGRADTVVISTSQTGNQTYTGPALIDLGPGTSFNLTLDRDTRVAILFTAECTLDSAGTAVWLDLDLRVDFAAVPESDDTDDAFCSASGGALDDWISAAHHVTIDLTSGSHTIQVRGLLQGGAPADSWWIGDLNLSVIGQEH